MNIISWAPHECGCVLACASSDGAVSVLEFKDNSWEHQVLPAHGIGVNAVSWAPASLAGSLTNTQPGEKGMAQRRFVTGGSDCAVKIWEFDNATKSYHCSLTLSGHTDWVRDVSWSPTILQKSYIASASQDKTVRIWTSTPQQQEKGEWKSTVLNFESVCWRVSWSPSGNVLAVSGGDNKVTLWRESLKGEWSCVKTIEE